MLRRLAGRSGRGPHDIVVGAEVVRAYLDRVEVPTADDGPLVVGGG